MRTLAASLALTIAFAASATENGTTSFPSGGDDFLVAAMPPPGFYGVIYTNRYRADHVAGSSGDLPFERFDLRVNALALRFDWVKPVTVFGADRWGTLFVVPLLDVDLAATPAPGVTIAGSRSGVGDLALGNALHWTFERYHAMLAVDVIFPTGRYDANETVNLGRNQWVLRLNHMGTWFPTESWDVSYRVHTDINFRNRDTGYLSGRTAYLNLAVGWKPTPATTVGVSSYFLKQLSDDRLDGARGPRRQPDRSARNRTRGKALLPQRHVPHRELLQGIGRAQPAARREPLDLCRHAFLRRSYYLINPSSRIASFTAGRAATRAWNATIFGNSARSSFTACAHRVTVKR